MNILSIYNYMSYKKYMISGGESPYITALISKKNQQIALTNSTNPLYEDYSPVSGYEPKYNPKKWNTNPRIKDSHNCYAYALNSFVASRTNKPQPGYFAKYPHISNGNYTCEPFIKRLRKDIPSIYDTTFKGKCKKGFYKIYMAVTKDSPDTDYHFYRQDSNSYWSHKPGRTDITNLDASGKLIKNPDTANRKYTYYNYGSGCGFFCINTKLSRAAST